MNRRDFLTAAAAMIAVPAIADDKTAAAYAAETHFAYVMTPGLAENTRLGVEALAAFMSKKSSVDDAIKVIGIDIEKIDKDEFLLLPFIVWPIAGNALALSQQARAKIGDYIAHGGVFLFDMHNTGATLSREEALRRLPEGITPKSLVEFKSDHILSKTFYLVSNLPGTKAFGPVWVEAPGAKGSEKVSSFIIGNNNWADAWSGRLTGENSDAQQNALRAGANMVIYALTGNYKEDAIHTPEILERLRL